MKALVQLVTPILIFASLSACQTTGNPKEGGLFGWSEEKAKLRAESLAQRRKQLNTELKSLQNQNKQLDKEATELKDSITARRKTINKLANEQLMLVQKITAQNAKNEAGKELQGILANLFSSKHVVCENNCYVPLPDESLTEEMIQRIRTENDKLIQTIGLITGF